jgi:hypothetical protein
MMAKIYPFCKKDYLRYYEEMEYIMNKICLYDKRHSLLRFHT